MGHQRARVLLPHRALAAGAALASIAYDPSAGAADAKRAIGLAAAVAALALVIAQPRCEQGRARAATAPACALWIGFVAWSAVTLAWGSPSGAGSLGTWVGATGLLVASMRFPIELARRAAGLTAAIVGAASSLAAIAAHAGGARGLAIHGGHGNPNWLGLVLALTLPLSIDLAAAERRSAARSWPVTAIAAALQAPALLLSHSRVAWIATIVALLIWAFSARPTRFARAAIAGSLAAALSICGAAASASSTGTTPAGVLSAQSGRPDSSPADEEDDAPAASRASDVPIGAAWDGRLWIWRASADAARRALPLGGGLGSFAGAYLDAQGARLAPLDPKSASRRFVNAVTAHCDWLEITVDAGLLGLALLLGAILFGVLDLLRIKPFRGPHRSPNGDAAPNRWPAGAAALVAFTVCAMGDSPMRQPGVMIPLALVLGASRRTGRGRSLPGGAITAGILLCGAAILLGTSVGTWLCVRRLTLARDALPEVRLPLLASAVRLDPRSGEAALSLGLARLELGDIPAALRELERARGLLANIGTDLAIGNAHMLADAPEPAVKAYLRALERHPGYFRAHANITEALTSLGRLDEAAAHLAVAQSLWPGHPKLAPIAERLRRARIDADTFEPPISP